MAIEPNPYRRVIGDTDLSKNRVTFSLNGLSFVGTDLNPIRVSFRDRPTGGIGIKLDTDLMRLAPNQVPRPYGGDDLAVLIAWLSIVLQSAT